MVNFENADRELLLTSNIGVKQQNQRRFVELQDLLVSLQIRHRDRSAVGIPAKNIQGRIDLSDCPLVNKIDMHSVDVHWLRRFFK